MYLVKLLQYKIYFLIQSNCLTTGSAAHITICIPQPYVDPVKIYRFHIGYTLVPTVTVFPGNNKLVGDKIVDPAISNIQINCIVILSRNLNRCGY